jgi:hypothetical protein
MPTGAWPGGWGGGRRRARARRGLVGQHNTAPPPEGSKAPILTSPLQDLESAIKPIPAPLHNWGVAWWMGRRAPASEGAAGFSRPRDMVVRMDMLMDDSSPGHRNTEPRLSATRQGCVAISHRCARKLDLRTEFARTAMADGDAALACGRESRFSVAVAGRAVVELRKAASPSAIAVRANSTSAPANEVKLDWDSFFKLRASRRRYSRQHRMRRSPIPGQQTDRDP